MTEKRPVIVIGKRTCSPLEQDALHTIGYGLATVGRPLHTTASPGAPAHIIEGYRAAGGEPTIHTAGLGNVDGETICIPDIDLATKLDQKVPDWDDRDWIVLHDEELLIDWASAMVSILEETGRSLVTQ